MMRRTLYIAFVGWAMLLAGLVSPVSARELTEEDHRRADEISRRMRNQIYPRDFEVNWFDEDRQLWYRVQVSPEVHRFIHVDVEAGKRGEAFDHDKLARQLNEAAGKTYRGDDLPLRDLRFDAKASTAEFTAGGKTWSYDLQAEKLTGIDKLTLPAGQKSERLPRTSRRRRGRNTSTVSPDGRWRAEIEGFNVRLRDTETGETHELSSNGKADDPYLPRFYWSPDSTRLIVPQEKAGEPRDVYLVESSPRRQLQPTLQKYRYPKPGDKLPIQRPRLFNIETRKQLELDDQLFDNPYRIDRLRWDADSSRFTFMFNRRGHQALRLIAIYPDGKVKALIDETSETFVCYSGKQFLHETEDSDEFIWMSERDGWNHLYLIDATTGEVKNQITTGEWVVREVKRVDPEERKIWFTAGGIHADQDPYHVHYCCINFDGTGLVKLTAGDGTYEEPVTSPQGKYLLARYSRVDMPAVVEVRRASDGKQMCELERGSTRWLERRGWKPPVRFQAAGRDGKTQIYGVIHRPVNFDPQKKYPVIEKIYAGPHSAHVPKRFSSSHGSAQAMAELGFVVVQIDGMGTSHRSKKFHDVCWQNLGDAGFPDRVPWIKAAAGKYPWMDIARVGIYGGSAGGQNAMRALISHNDFYQVAVADCGCHDNRMDKIWWNEQWMGWPIGKHYSESSNVDQAHRMKGKLLLIWGELDRNVDPASSMQVVNALVRADKKFEMLIIPGTGHAAAGTRYGARRQREFFARHLLK